MRYKCQFPNCNYSTDDRHTIHYHHIKPKELGGSNKDFNRVWLCPNHHNLVYIPEAKIGIHSIKTEKSIIILGWLSSTDGKVLAWSKPEDPLKDLFYLIGGMNET